MAFDLSILICHPAHDRGVRIHIGCRDVAIGTDDVIDRANISARKTLQFEPGETLWIDLYAALRSAEGQIHNRAFDSHPETKRSHFLSSHLRVKSNPALRWTASIVILNSPAFEGPQRPVIHAYRNVHMDGQFRLCQSFACIIRCVEMIVNDIKALWVVVIRLLGVGHRALIFVGYALGKVLTAALR